MAGIDLDTMRGLVRRDLRDEDPADERWSDDELDRHIGRALDELSLAAPLETSTTLTTSAGSRDLDVSSLAERVAIDAVEFPTGEYPPSLVSFSLWGDTLTMDLEGVPSGGQDVIVRWARTHTLDGSGSTLPAALEDLVATGAAAYAALEWSSYATNRLNVGGADTWSHFHTWAQERLAAFHKALAKHGRQRRLRSRRLFVPAGGALGARPLGE
ncbi:MAG: hypothetical protein R3C39_03910 [Dehalococcoidia bacterium]